MDDASSDSSHSGTSELERQRSSSAPCSPRGQKTERAERPTQKISVVCRFRPENVEEMKIGQSVATFGSDGRTVIIRPADRPVLEEHRYEFSRVFQPHTEQHEMFAAVGTPVVSGLMEGINCSVIAYGQTGSGKTYTMMGKTDPETGNVVGQEGLVPRTLRALFVQLCQLPSDMDVRVELAFIEVYMEKVFDLLRREETRSSPAPPPQMNDATWMFTLADGSVVINQATTHPVTSEDRAMRLVQDGLSRRRTSATKSNVLSSRSHAVLLLTLRTKDATTKELTVVQLYLVDLAGSEKMAKTEAEGLSVDEAKTINTSLFALGKVVAALSSKGRRGSQLTHIPFRDSKLTRLLANSLHGNARSFIVLTCSPSAYNETESMSTLRFGMQAQRISTRPRKVVIRTTAELEVLLRQSEAEVSLLRGSVEYLKVQLRSAQARGGAQVTATPSGARTGTRQTRPTPALQPPPSTRDEGASSAALGQLVSMVDRAMECPLRARPMADPVVALDGYTYDRTAVHDYLLSHDMRSPMTGAQLTALILTPNMTLKALRDECCERRLTPAGMGAVVTPYTPFKVALLIRLILEYIPLTEWVRYGRISSEFGWVVHDREWWAPLIEEHLQRLAPAEQKEISRMSLSPPVVYNILAQHGRLSIAHLKSREEVLHTVKLFCS